MPLLLGKLFTGAFSRCHTAYLGQDRGIIMRRGLTALFHAWLEIPDCSHDLVPLGLIQMFAAPPCPQRE